VCSSVQLQCLLFLFLLHAFMPIYRLIRSISPTSVSTDPSRQRWGCSLIFMQGCRVGRVKLLPCFCTNYKTASAPSSSAPRHSPSIVVSHKKVQTKHHQSSSWSNNPAVSISLSMHVSVPSKPPHTMHVMQTTSELVLFLSISSCYPPVFSFCLTAPCIVAHITQHMLATTI
jgi:hypothetical protein